MAKPRRILIVRLSSLGDIIHALPAFESLRRARPDAMIGWLVESRLAFLLTAVEGVDRIHPVDTHAMRAHVARIDGWKKLWEPLREVRACRYDEVLDFQGLLKTAFLSVMSGAGTRFGFSKSLVRERPAHLFYHRTVANPGPPMHVARLNMLLAAEAGGTREELCVRLKAREEDMREVDARLQREQLSDFVVINPGGGWPTKRWQPARYGSLAARIQVELRLRAVIVTGPGEEPLYRQIAEVCADPPPAHFPVPFLQLIPLFRRARLLVGGDTGPMHLACALGTPVVAIMGPTSPVRNGPWSDSDEVVVRRLPCSFCNGRSCPTENECMDISAEEVFAAVARRLERAK